MRYLKGIFSSFFIVILMLAALPAWAQQNWALDIDGSVISQNDKSKMSGAKVTIFKNGSRSDQVMTDSRGKFQLSLLPDAKYMLEFSADGYVTKRISFSTKNVPPDLGAEGNFQFRFDMTLFKKMEGLDVSILNKPLAEVMYDPTLYDFNYDKEYTKSIKAQIEKLQEDLENQMAAEEAAAKEKEAAFQKAMSEGDKAASKNDYEAAKRHFNEAVAMKPDDNSAKNKLDNAQKNYDKQRAEKNAEKTYNEAIENAELALYDKRFKEAEQEFLKALDAKPGDLYARDEIKKIRDQMVNMAKAEQTYLAAIGKGDQFMKEKNYLGAKGEYTKAAEAKPDETYPKEQLKQVDALLAEDAKKQTAYIQAIERGETSMENKDYEAAKAAFEQASGIKPDEKYPKDQLAKITGLLAEIALKNKGYDDAIKQGDEAFAKADFTNATKAYKDALGLKPDQQYPKDQLAAIAKKEEEMKQNEARYAELIKGADTRYDSRDFIAAKAEYTKALELKPNEAHPKTRIDEIAGILEKEAKIENEYKAAIANADNAFKAKDYTSAKFEYSAASKLKPDEAYPKEQLEKVEGFLADLAKTEEAYSAAVKKGDELFNAGTMDGAKEQYTKAAGLKPEEEYPKTQLKLIEEKLIELANKNKQYDEAIAAADKLFNEKKLEEAKTSYQKALDVKPDEAYPKDQIAAITNQLAEAKEQEASYKAALAEADGALGKKDYASAKASYEKASGIKPDETYPKDKLAEIAKILADQEARQTQYQELIAKADAAFNANKLEEALPVYKEAAGLMESESYPVTQITLIEDKLKNQKALEENYKAAIAAAETAEKSGELDKALASFKEASGLKSDEQYPKDKVAELTSLIADKAKTETAYNEAIALADEAKKNKEYDIALNSYKKASELKPKEEYPINQINEVEVLKAEALAAIELANKQEESYKALIKEGDDLFTAANYPGAKSKYKAALEVKPTEEYPQKKIAEIDGLMASQAEEKEKDAKYNELIATADKAFKAKDWEPAKAAYSEAKAVKPGESYPDEQLKAIDVAIAEAAALASQQEAEAVAKAKDEKYQALIAEADKAFKEKQWEPAKAAYTEAKGVKPEESYPTEQIAAIEAAIAEAAALANQQEAEAAAKAKEEQYQGLIATADKAFKAKEWESAKTTYKEAKGVKPDATYPDEQIAAIEAAIAEAAALANQQEAEAAAKAREEKYNGLISAADKAFKSKEWETAKSSYQEAQTVKPNETYPADQIKAIDEAIAAENALAKKEEQEAAAKERDAKYKELVVAGDKAFQSKDWEVARNNYTEAQGLKPTETYPGDQLKAIDAAIAEEQALASQLEADAAEKAKEEKYKSFIASADKDFKSNNWESAKLNYQEALKVKPQETYPTERIKLVEEEMKKAALVADSKAEKEQYETHLAAADQAFKAKDWQTARTKYQAALGVFPEEKYPAEQLIKVDEELAKADAIALKNKRDEEYRQIIGDADQLFNAGDFKASKGRYQAALGIKPDEIYPQNRIAEIDEKLASIEEDATAKEKQYNALIAKGDTDFDNKNYTGAKTAFRNALDIKPEESYPKNKLSEIEKLQAELAEEREARDAGREKREQYNAYILKADRAFSSKQYPTARQNYSSASDMFPEESYPQERIKEIDNIIKKQNVADAAPVKVPKKKSSGMSEAEIAAMMAKWQDEREQAKVDRMNQYQKDLKETSDERIADSDDRRNEANEGLDQLAVTMRESNKAGADRNLTEAKLIEEVREDHQSYLESQAKSSETRRNNMSDDLIETQNGQVAMKEKGNELYVINTERKMTEKIELTDAQRTRDKEGYNRVLVNRESLDELEEGIREENESHQADHMKDVERIQNENDLIAATFHNWTDESRERRGEALNEVQDLEENIREFREDNGTSYAANTEKYNNVVQERSEYLNNKQKQSEESRNDAYGKIEDYTENVKVFKAEQNNRYQQNNEAIQQEQTDIADYHAQISANADERRMKFNRDFYTGEELPRLPEVAKQYPQGVTEETFEENNAFIIKRYVVKGENIDEYSKIYYKWGGIYYKKNGEAVTEVIWNTETQ